MSRSVIRDGNGVLKEILKLVSEGYEVSFRPDFGDAFQIRLYKDDITSYRVILHEQLRYTTTRDAEEYLIHSLIRLLLEHECYRRSHDAGNSV